MFVSRLLLVVFLFAFFGKPSLGQNRTFEITEEGFMKDGEYFRYISGTVQYYRVHPNYWRDRLRKLRYAGCNVLQTYIEWSSHEPEPGVYDFDGYLNITAYLDIAVEEDLLVILRPGPFIDSERDMGGLPYWLLRENPNMQIRSNDPTYMFYVEQWYGVLFPMLEPYLYHNGGPVIMVQVENEYGSWPPCDMYHTASLRDLTVELLGDEIALFTTDIHDPYYLKCGVVANVYATVDFGPEIDTDFAFRAQRVFEPQGPLVNSEFYPGWLDLWGYPHSGRSTENVTVVLDEILERNASVNIYVFCGGTSFGLKSGSKDDSNVGAGFRACPTSYDFDAPLTEVGDLTEKYWGIRNITSKYVTLPAGDPPVNTPKAAYGNVSVVHQAGVLEMPQFLDTIVSEYPLTFEALSVASGLVTYAAVIPYSTPDPELLRVPEIHDRGYVFVDDEYIGLLSRELGGFNELPIYIEAGQTLSIVTESQGRICYGIAVTDFKGLLNNVTLGDEIVTGWSMTGLPLTNITAMEATLEKIQQKEERNTKIMQTPSGGMATYGGNFTIEGEPDDTFLRLDGWGKGFAWVNGFLLGRYWPLVGPQMTLYIPKYHLQTGVNTLLLLELEQAPCAVPAECVATLTDIHELDGPVPPRGGNIIPPK